MLRKPRHPLPRQFNRPLTKQTRTFVERRHRRAQAHRTERWKRWVRRWRSAAAERFTAARRWAKFLLAGAVLFVACMLLFSPVLHVREIRVVRAEGRVDLAKVLTALSPLYGRHLLFVSTHDVSSRVREVVPDASEVTVSKHYPSELLVRINLLPLVARLRIEPVSSGSGALAGSGARLPQQTDYLTQNGLYVTASHVTLTQPLPLIRVVDWGVRPIPSAHIVTAEFLDALRRAEDALALEFGQQIRSRTIFLRAREFHIDTQAISFWFDVRSPLEDQLQRLRTFLQTVKLQDVKSYVDLRLIGRVVYK